MKKNEIRAMLKRLDDTELPERAAMLDGCRIPEQRERPAFKRRGMIPVIVAAVLILLFGVTACTIDEVEHQRAVRFFDEHGLETEGLSRAELRKVYKDITTGSFSLNVTADVVTHKVGGYEVLFKRPDSDELKELWNRQFGIPEETKGVLYKYYPVDPNAEYEQYTVEKYIDGEEIYKLTLDKNRLITNHVEYGDSILVFGKLRPGSNEYTYYQGEDGYVSNGMGYIFAENCSGWAALIDGEGNLVWEKLLNNGLKNEVVISTIMDSKGITLFSSGNTLYNSTPGSITMSPNGGGMDVILSVSSSCMGITELDSDGNTLSFVKHEDIRGMITGATRLGDGYLIGLWNMSMGESVVHAAADGSISDALSYDVDGRTFSIDSMLEYNGKVYLSGYTVPKSSSGDYGNRAEIEHVLMQVHESGGLNIPGDELTELMRENYTAMLLVFDSKMSEPQEFYSAVGSIGKSLSIADDGTLLWTVETIEGESEYTPATSAFSIMSPTLIYDYTFTTSGVLDSIQATGEQSRLIR